MEEKQRKGTQTSSNRANKATRNENTSSPPRPKRRTTPTSWAPQKKRRCDPEPEAKPSGQHEQKKPKTNGNNVPRRGDSLPLFTEPPFEDLFRAKDLRMSPNPMGYRWMTDRPSRAGITTDHGPRAPRRCVE